MTEPTDKDLWDHVYTSMARISELETKLQMANYELARMREMPRISTEDIEAALENINGATA